MEEPCPPLLMATVYMKRLRVQSQAPICVARSADAEHPCISANALRPALASERPCCMSSAPAEAGPEAGQGGQEGGSGRGILGWAVDPIRAA